MPDATLATDEDIALRASADFALLCPRDQKLAAGTDGFFAPNDRWTLRSPSVDFSAQGVYAGQVVQLLGPASIIRSPGESLIVESASGSAVTLRRKGQLFGEGQPPAPAAGSVGIEFLVATLKPQILGAGRDVQGRLGLGDAELVSTLFDQATATALRDAVVLSTLYRQYRDMCREAAGPSSDLLASKAIVVKQEFEERVERLILRLGLNLGIGSEKPLGRLSARLSR
jgi:hypothetical protein